MAEPSVDPLVPHLFLLSLTLFPLPPLCPLPPGFQLDGVDGLGRTPRFGRSSVRRSRCCAALGLDRIGIGSDRMATRVASRVYMARLSMVGVPFHRARSSPLNLHNHQSDCTLPFGLAHSIPPQSTPCVYEQHRMATSSACFYRPHMPPLTHWPSPIRLEHSDVEGARAPSPATRTSSTLPWPSPPLTPWCLTSSF